MFCFPGQRNTGVKGGKREPKEYSQWLADPKTGPTNLTNTTAIFNGRNLMAEIINKQPLSFYLPNHLVNKPKII